MTPLEKCFAEGKLQTVPPSEEKAQNSILAAREYLDEAEQVVESKLYRLAMNGAYMAWFHAARALLFRDGIREKSHYCIEHYLRTYVVSGKLEEKWVILFGRIRNKRDKNQYSFGPPESKDELDGALTLAGEFIDTIEKLLRLE